MQVRDRIRKRYYQLLAEREERLAKSITLKKIVNGVKGAWKHLDSNRESREGLSYDELFSLFGNINRTEAQEVFNALQESKKQSVHKEQRKLAAKTDVQKR